MNCVWVVVKVPSEMTSEEQTKSLFYRPSLESMEKKQEVSLHPALPFACPHKAGGPKSQKILAFAPPNLSSGSLGCLQWVQKILLFSGQILATPHYLTPNGGLVREIPGYFRKIWLGELLFFDPYFWSEKKPQPKATEPTHIARQGFRRRGEGTEFSVFFCETSIRW